MNRLRTPLYHLARCALAAVFLYAGGVKLLDPLGFAGQIAAYQFLPLTGNILVAAMLPTIELLAGGLLLCPRSARPAALVILILNLVFLAALASAWTRGLAIDCGCFRPGAASSSIPLAILRDLLFVAGAVIVLRYRPAPRCK